MSVFADERVPWSEPIELGIWFVAVILTTIAVHNGMRMYRERRPIAPEK